MAENEKLNFILDSQLLDAVQTCSVKFLNDFTLHLRPLQPSRKMDMGSLMHDLYKVYNSKLMVGEDHEAAQSAACDAFHELEQDYELDSVDTHTVKAAFIEHSNYKRDPRRHILSVETPETKLLYEDEVLRIAYVTKIDVHEEGQNYRAPKDYKTEHRRNDPSKLRNQFVGYAWATGDKRIIVSKIGFQKSLKPDEKFRDYVFTYDDSELNEWLEETVEWARHMIELVQGTRKAIKARTQCDNFGGCKYKGVCGIAPEGRIYALKANFREGKPWSPFNEADETE